MHLKRKVKKSGCFQIIKMEYDGWLRGQQKWSHSDNQSFVQFTEGSGFTLGIEKLGIGYSFGLSRLPISRACHSSLCQRRCTWILEVLLMVKSLLRHHEMIGSKLSRSSDR